MTWSRCASQKAVSDQLRGHHGGGTDLSFVRVADDPDHCRSGPLESPHRSVEPACGFVEAFEHVDLAVLADKRDGESVDEG